MSPQVSGLSHQSRIAQWAITMRWTPATGKDLIFTVILDSCLHSSGLPVILATFSDSGWRKSARCQMKIWGKRVEGANLWGVLWCLLFLMIYEMGLLEMEKHCWRVEGCVRKQLEWGNRAKLFLSSPTPSMWKHIYVHNKTSSICNIHRGCVSLLLYFSSFKLLLRNISTIMNKSNN